jgi:hypothetical protein
MFEERDAGVNFRQVGELMTMSTMNISVKDLSINLMSDFGPNFY